MHGVEVDATAASDGSGVDREQVVIVAAALVVAVGAGRASGVRRAPLGATRERTRLGPLAPDTRASLCGNGEAVLQRVGRAGDTAAPLLNGRQRLGDALRALSGSRGLHRLLGLTAARCQTNRERASARSAKMHSGDGNRSHAAIAASKITMRSSPDLTGSTYS